MCLSCGCRDPHDDQGDPDSITYEDLERAAKAANGISVEQAVNNISPPASPGDDLTKDHQGRPGRSPGPRAQAEPCLLNPLGVRTASVSGSAAAELFGWFATPRLRDRGW